jgi:30S ribosomal protein S31
MGRGDKKTAKGKRAMGSYGNTRKRKTATNSVAPAVKKEAKPVAEKKTTTKKAAAPKATAVKKTAAKKTAKKED